MIKGQEYRIGVLLLDANADGVQGLTPSVDIRINETAWKTAANPPSDQGNGRYELLLDPAETEADSLQVFWSDPAAKSVLQNLYPLDEELFQADLTPVMKTSHISATGGKVDGVTLVDLTTDVFNPVVTDATSREASKADLTQLEADVADIPKRDDGDSYRQLRNGAGAIVQEIRETITTTQQS